MRKVSFICVLFIGCTLQAAIAQTDAKAQNILEAMAKKVKSMKSLKANFVLNITGGKVKDTKKGSLSLKGDKYHIDVDGQEIICDNKSVWTYNKEAKEVDISAYNPSEQSISPAKLLTGSYQKEYNSTYKGEKKEKGKTYDLVELTPKSADAKAARIDLMVDKATSLVSSGNIFEKNGNKIQYTISNFSANANIPDTYFTWDSHAHPGVETVDLR